MQITSCLVFLFIICVAARLNSTAAIFTWVGGTNGDDWNTDVNWSPSAGAPPGAADTAAFGPAGMSPIQTFINSPTSVGSIQEGFAPGQAIDIIGSQPLTIYQGITVSSYSSTHVFALDLILG